jgi:hypothetical protein
MQKNITQGSHNGLPTVKFFNFDLDALNLKKILDFYAWLIVAGLIVLLAIELISGRFDLHSVLEIFGEIALLGFGAFCCYFFRYSPYLHGILVVLCSYAHVDKISFLTKFRNDSYLIEKLKTIIFNEGKFNSIHAFFTESFFDNIPYYIDSFVIGVIFFYFAYAYQKLIRLNKVSN